MSTLNKLGEVVVYNLKDRLVWLTYIHILSPMSTSSQVVRDSTFSITFRIIDLYFWYTIANLFILTININLNIDFMHV